MHRINSVDHELALMRARAQTPLAPTESPLEDAFLVSTEKYLNPHATFELQVPVDTARGRYRLDTVIGRRGERIAIELDGKAFHSAESDARRDAAILEIGACDAVVRIRGRDVFGYPNLVWYILSRAFPWMVTYRAYTVLAEHLKRDLPEAVEPPIAAVSDRGGYVTWVVGADDRQRSEMVALRFHRCPPTGIGRAA